MLANYLPILIFLVVAALVACVLLGLGSGTRALLSRASATTGEALAVRVRLRRLRRHAHEVRRALLPGGDSVHRLRPGDRVSVSLGGGAGEDRRLRPCRHGHLSRDSGGRLYLRVEEGGARVGLERRGRREASPSAASSRLSSTAW